MKKVDLSMPALVFIVATRAVLGVGIGLLAAERIRRNKRRSVGAALVAVGALATIPAAIAVLRSSKAAGAKKAMAAA